MPIAGMKTVSTREKTATGNATRAETEAMTATRDKATRGDIRRRTPTTIKANLSAAMTVSVNVDAQTTTPKTAGITWHSADPKIQSSAN